MITSNFDSKKTRHLDIVFSSDDNYAQLMGVAICSIFENKKCENEINIYVLDGGILKDNKNKLKLLSEKYHFKIIYIEIDTFFFKDFFVNKHITQATYYRVMMPNLLPNIEKCLYLDCDIIVTGDIFELYSINIDNYFFAAVEEYVSDRQEELGMPQSAKYFNAGVMLFNLEKWRKFDTSKKIIEYIKRNSSKIKMWDQDALNAVMWDKWLNIDFKYNYTTSLLYKHPVNYNELEKHIVIIHYSDFFKPYNYLSRHPLNKKYFYYLNKTPWIDKKFINKTFKNIIIKKMKTFLSPKSIHIIKIILLKIKLVRE